MIIAARQSDMQGIHVRIGMPQRTHNKGAQTLSVRVIFNQRTWRSADVALTDRRSTWFSAARNPIGEHLDQASACCFPPPQERPERQRANAHGGPSKPKG